MLLSKFIDGFNYYFNKLIGCYIGIIKVIVICCSVILVLFVGFVVSIFGVN